MWPSARAISPVRCRHVVPRSIGRAPATGAADRTINPAAHTAAIRADRRIRSPPWVVIARVYAATDRPRYPSEGGRPTRAATIRADGRDARQRRPARGTARVRRRRGRRRRGGPLRPARHAHAAWKRARPGLPDPGRDGTRGRAEDLERERGCGDRRHGDRRRAACAGGGPDAPGLGAARRARRGRRRGPVGLPRARARRRGGRAPRARVDVHARRRLDRPAQARRRRALRLRRHDRAAGPRASFLLPSVGGSHAAVGRAARVVAAADDRCDRGPRPSCVDRRCARPFRDRCGPAVVVPSIAGDPRRRHARQRARGRPGSDQRHHRFRRHEPLGPRVRPVRRARVSVARAAAGRCRAARDALHRRVPVGHPARARGAGGAARPPLDAARDRRGVVRMARASSPRQRVSARVGGTPVAVARVPRDGRAATAGGAAAGRRARRGRARVDRAAPVGVRAGAVPAHVRPPAAPRARGGRVAGGRRRRAIPGLLQQRAGRRSLPSARHRRDRAPVTAAQYEHALSARRRDRAGRAVARDDAPGLGARHGAVRELGERGQRHRVAARDGVDRRRRWARELVRLSRRDAGDHRRVARGMARWLSSRARRGLRRARPVSRRHRSCDGRRGPAAGDRASAGTGDAAGGRVRRRRVHLRRDPGAAGRLRPRARGADARGRRALRGGRGPGRARPLRRGAVVLRGGRRRPPTSSRWASRWATGTRWPP